MLCPPPRTLNPVTIFEAARLPHRANPSRAAGSFIGQRSCFKHRGASVPPAGRWWPQRRKAMGHSEYDPCAKDRRPWNAGRKIGAKRALKAQQ